MSDLFDWDASNVAHIALHDVTPGEAEEVILNNPLDLDHTVENGEVASGRSAKRRASGFLPSLRRNAVL